ncbi:MAG: hypothetical protein HZA89_13005 [Verrucomicrobia bacterium]|nr:hypothetical protein [Verrucomicrobiota bacterium]
MRHLKLFLTLAGLCAALAATAATPPAEKLLPADTLGVFTVPDWDQAAAAYRPALEIWRDPALKPFTDKFTEQFKAEIIVPLERELGIKLADYADLVHGQLTVAVLQNGWRGEPAKNPGVIVLLDTKDKSDQLKKTLADLKKKWTDGGKQLKTEKLRDVEVTTLVFTGDELSKSFDNAFNGGKPRKKKPSASDADGVMPPKKNTLAIAQSGPLLLLSDAPANIEKILARQSGSSEGSLAEDPVFEANRAALFRDATGFLWVNVRPLVEALERNLKLSATATEEGGQANPLMPNPATLIPLLGLKEIKSLALHLHASSSGWLVNFFIGAPESTRRGLFKLLAFEAKDSAPPSFIPADTAKFQRLRIDGSKTWANIETLLGQISPQMKGMVAMSMAAAGKDRDENFDLKKELIGNLGNDVVVWQKIPRSAALEDIGAPPTLILVGSPAADKLAQAVRTGSSLTSPELPKEREFLGRKIFTLKLPPKVNPKTGRPVENNFQFAASGGYLALSSDTAMLEEYLRSKEGAAKPLAELAGLREAAQQVGGTSTGWFIYENQIETMRLLFEAARTDPKAFDQAFSLPGAGAGLGDTGLKKWMDFSLLPPFEKIAKYFSFTVSAGSATADGIHFKAYSPLPPSLKK